MPPKEKDQTLEFKLYIEDTGMVIIHSGISVELWDEDHTLIWHGTPEEFWDLILKGIETAKKEV